MGKAHAASYGKVAYQTAYMKANFPAIYMSAVLTADSGDTEKIAETINECTRMQIPVLPPDINESFAGFSVVRREGSNPDRIRFGLTTIKNFGEGIAKFIIEERKKNGHFKNLEEFLSRIHDRNLNKKSLEALIKSGAMDRFGERGQMMANIETLLEYNKESVGNKDQNSLFGASTSPSASTPTFSTLHLEKVAPTPPAERLAWEKELLGLYVSGHPLEQYKEKLASQKNNIKKIKESAKENDSIVVVGLVGNVREILTKNGEKMLFLKLVDLTDEIELVVFPRTLQEFPGIFLPDQCLAVKARVSLRNGELSLIAEKAKKL